MLLPFTFLTVILTTPHMSFQPNDPLVRLPAPFIKSSSYACGSRGSCYHAFSRHAEVEGDTILQVVQSGNTITVTPSREASGGTEVFKASDQPSTSAEISGPKNGKEEWPELLGKDCQEAKQAIEASDDSLNVYVVPLGSAVTMDYQTNRVRIYCGTDGKVQKKPKIG